MGSEMPCPVEKSATMTMKTTEVSTLFLPKHRGMAGQNQIRQNCQVSFTFVQRFYCAIA